MNMANERQWEDVRLFSFELQTMEFTYATVRITPSSTPLLMPTVGLYTIHLLRGLVNNKWF